MSYLFRFLIAAALLFMAVHCAASVPVKKIKIRKEYYHGSYLTKELYYDTAGRVFFEKDFDERKTTGWWFDKHGSCIRQIVHVPGGYTIYDFENDAAGHCLKKYKSEEAMIVPTMGNDRPKKSFTIGKFQSREELLNDSIVQRMLKHEKRALVQEFFYDRKGNLIREVPANVFGKELTEASHTYNDQGKRTRTKYVGWPGRAEVRYTYDSLGRMDSLQDYDESGYMYNCITYTYDVHGNPVELKWHNSVPSRNRLSYVDGKLVLKEGYDKDGVLAIIDTYGYNENGDLVSTLYVQTQLHYWEEITFEYEYY